MVSNPGSQCKSKGQSHGYEALGLAEGSYRRTLLLKDQVSPAGTRKWVSLSRIDFNQHRCCDGGERKWHQPQDVTQHRGRGIMNALRQSGSEGVLYLRRWMQHTHTHARTHAHTNTHTHIQKESRIHTSHKPLCPSAHTKASMDNVARRRKRRKKIKGRKEEGNR